MHGCIVFVSLIYSLLVDAVLALLPQAYVLTCASILTTLVSFLFTARRRARFAPSGISAFLHELIVFVSLFCSLMLGAALALLPQA